MSDSEIITILILFYLSDYRTLKTFYTEKICREWRRFFPPTVLFYNRFVELQQMVSVKLCLFLSNGCLGNCTGVSIIDSCPIRVRHDKRARRRKPSESLPQVEGTMGSFFGFKLHIIINERVEIVQWKLTQAYVDDRTLQKDNKFTEKVFGKLVVDIEYISHDLFEKLFVDDIH